MANTQNSHGSTQILQPVRQRVKSASKGVQQGYDSTRAWLGKRSVLQIVLMILIPVLLIAALAGYLYNTQGRKPTRRRAARTSRSRAQTRPRSAPARKRTRGRGRHTRAGTRTTPRGPQARAPSMAGQ